MIKTNNFRFILFSVACLLIVASCKPSRELNTEISNVTGWSYNGKQSTNYEALEGDIKTTPIGMVAIQGGLFSIGENDEYITAPRNNSRRNITVNSFYMDKYEITNLNWREYVHWVKMMFGQTAPDLIRLVLPDTTVWREELAYNEPYLENYYNHPAYSFYPVVGVSWNQAMDYCQWRTDRVNEKILIDGGYIAFPNYALLYPSKVEDEVRTTWEKMNPDYKLQEVQVDLNSPLLAAANKNSGKKSKNESEAPEGTKTSLYCYPYDYIRDKLIFNVEKYLTTDYSPAPGAKAATKKDAFLNARKITRADGIFLPSYRLPTEAEWEFAAYAPIAGEDGLTIEGKLYPWGYKPRSLDRETMGKLMANFVRGKGDMMGVSGALNDGAIVTAPVDAYAPNDFGLYNMAGNVNEWVLDVYRETSNADVAEYNSYRGNVYSNPKKDASGKIQLDSMGRVEMEFTMDEDKRDYHDGDSLFRLDCDFPLDTTGLEPGKYKIDPTDVLAPKFTKTLHVYKGGSWKDRVFWLNPTARRSLEADKSSSTIGFRCAMSTVGTQMASTYDAVNAPQKAFNVQ